MTNDSPESIIAEDIASLLSERVGETGTACIKDGGLYFRREVNSAERYLGKIDDLGDPGSCRQAVSDFLNG